MDMLPAARLPALTPGHPARRGELTSLPSSHPRETSAICQGRDRACDTCPSQQLRGRYLAVPRCLSSLNLAPSWCFAFAIFFFFLRLITRRGKCWSLMIIQHPEGGSLGPLVAGRKPMSLPYTLLTQPCSHGSLCPAAFPLLSLTDSYRACRPLLQEGFQDPSLQSGAAPLSFQRHVSVLCLDGGPMPRAERSPLSTARGLCSATGTFRGVTVCESVSLLGL